MAKNLTDKQIETKRAELETKLGRTVYVFMFLTREGEQIIGYVKDPERLVKMRAMDMLMQSLSGSCEMLLKACLIAEESSPRLSSEKAEDDKVFISALLEVLCSYNEGRIGF